MHSAWFLLYNCTSLYIIRDVPGGGGEEGQPNVCKENRIFAFPYRTNASFLTRSWHHSGLAMVLLPLSPNLTSSSFINKNVHELN